MKFKKLLKTFWEQIPDRYNQTKLLKYLDNPLVDVIMSISNRSDGKSFNHVKFFIFLAWKLDIKFMLIARHYTLRQAYVTLLTRIYEKSNNLNLDDLTFRRTDFYIIIYHKGSVIGIITDLNAATDLKYSSNFLEDFPIIVYDEFLCLECDYLVDEWEKLEVIYTSVDRKGKIPIIGSPKLVLLGNAVNFSSPVLAGLDVFNYLERHEINTEKLYNNIAIELRRNDFANEEKNTTLFNNANSALNQGSFDFNLHMLASEQFKKEVRRNGQIFSIKLERGHLVVEYDTTNFRAILKYMPYSKNDYFAIKLSDTKEGIEFLKDTYYKDNFYKKYQTPIYKFDNSFTKNLVLNDSLLCRLKINKCISEHMNKNRNKDLLEQLEDKNNYNTEYLVLNKLMKKFEEF